MRETGSDTFTVKKLRLTQLVVTLPIDKGKDVLFKARRTNTPYRDREQTTTDSVNAKNRLRHVYREETEADAIRRHKG